jgi:hypothetical protein
LVHAADVIRLKSRTIDTAEARSTDVRGAHLILQFNSWPGRETLRELERRGVRVLEYVPDSALLVSSDSSPHLEGLGVRWAGPLEVSDKLSPALVRRRYGVFLVIFHRDVAQARARDLVRWHGLWILEHPDLLPGHVLASGSESALADLATRDEVAYILPASTDLIAGRRVMGCGGAMTESGPIGEYVQVSPGWSRGPDGHVALSYIFQTLTPKMDENVVRGEMARALGEWARYGDLAFSPGAVVSAARTVTILFARGAHGDGYAFDGPGGVLAHTFYPSPPIAEPIAGDMHLDADENWRVGSGIDLFSVALHEAGHALGLGHSSQPGTVMYPYYHLLTGLTNDDIAGIRSLYATAGTQPASPTNPVSPVPAPTPAPPTPVPPAQPDRTPPTLRILSPSSTIVSTYTDSILVTGTATDDQAVAAVRWSSSTGGSGTASGTNSWSVRVPLLVGTNTVTIRAYDAAGNSGWRALTVVRH